MIWILTTRGAATKLRNAPFTETAIAGVHSVVYRAGVAPVAQTGSDASSGPAGTFARGLHRISGVVWSLDGAAGESLLGMEAAIDLIIRYRANGERRKRTLANVIFVGDVTVSFPGLNRGVPELVGVPFRVQIPEGETIGDHVIDEGDA